MARARAKCNDCNTRCSSAADRIIVRFLHEPRPTEFSFYSFPHPRPFFFSSKLSLCFQFSFPVYLQLSAELPPLFLLTGRGSSLYLYLGWLLAEWLAGQTFGIRELEGPEARNSRDPEHVACALSQRRSKILRATYVFVTYTLARLLAHPCIISHAFVLFLLLLHLLLLLLVLLDFSRIYSYIEKRIGYIKCI